MRTLAGRLLAVTFMALVICAGAYQFAQPATVAAATQLCSSACYSACSKNDRYCRANPDGYWNNGYAGGPCSEFTTTDFCCKWECPNSTPTGSPCTRNPTLPGCAYSLYQVPQNCETDARVSCTSACNAAVDQCQHGGRCVDVTVYTPYYGSGGCTCSWTVECY